MSLVGEAGAELDAALARYWAVLKLSTKALRDAGFTLTESDDEIWRRKIWAELEREADGTAKPAEPSDA
jgi:hypothetical protein